MQPERITLTDAPNGDKVDRPLPRLREHLQGKDMVPSDRALKLKLRAAALGVLAELDLDGPPRGAVSVAEQDDSGTDLTMTLRPSGDAKVVGLRVAEPPEPSANGEAGSMEGLLRTYWSPMSRAIVSQLLKEPSKNMQQVADAIRSSVKNSHDRRGGASPMVRCLLTDMKARGQLAEVHSKYAVTAEFEPLAHRLLAETPAP